MLNAPDIYDNFHAQATGTAGLTTAENILRDLADQCLRHAAALQKMIDDVRSGWRGDAAQAAAHGLAPLADSSWTTGQQLGLTADLISRQIASFHTAVAEVQPVPPGPRLQDAIGAVLTGSSPQPIMEQIAARHVIEQANVDAYAKYVGASQYNTANLPPLADSVTVQAAAVSVVGPADSLGGGSRLPSAEPRATIPAHTRTAAASPTSETTVAAKSGPIAPPQAGRPVAAFARSANLDPATTGEDPRFSTVTSSAGAPVRIDAGTEVQRGSGAGSAPSGPDGAAGEIVLGGPRIGGGAASETPVGSPGARSGSEAGRSAAVVEGEPAPGGADEVLAKARPETELPPAGPMGRGRPREDDQQRRSRFLVAEDGETRFGTAERVAPAVIGDDANGR